MAYRIEASPLLTDKANLPRRKPEDEEDQGPDTVAKYVAMFNRRMEKGQCFHRPYLGCREFAAHFSPPSQQDKVLTDWTESFGLMLYDFRFDADGVNRPGFFQASINHGVLHCDTAAKGVRGEEPVRVFGWDDEGGGP